MLRYGTRIAAALGAWLRPAPTISTALWLAVLGRYPFLASLDRNEQERLRALSIEFLRRKEFTGTHGLVITDNIALTIAAQACLPLLHWGDPHRALTWYDDFFGIVVHPTEVVAQRETTDSIGIVHHYREILHGEAMQGGPVMLTWPAIQQAGQKSFEDVIYSAHSVVIHEFVHKIDMRNSTANGNPLLPAGFMGTTNRHAAQDLWQTTWNTAWHSFCAQVTIAERFGGSWPWLDSYGATSPAEFFAVTCEAWFVDNDRFVTEFPILAPLLKEFFHPEDTDSREPLKTSRSCPIAHEQARQFPS